MTSLVMTERILAGIVVLLFVIWCYRIVLQKVQKNKFEHRKRKLQEQLYQRDQKRQQQIQQRELLYGIEKKRNPLLRLDLFIKEAGLQTYWKWMTAESFLFGGVVFMVFCGFFIYRCTASLFFVLIGCFLIWFLLFGSVYTVAGFRYRQIEKQLLVFLNLMDNYARTSDDLVEILGKVSFYLQEPIRQALIDFHAEAVNTGDVTAALKHLSVRISHRRFKETIRSLDICRRHESNYSEVIQDMRISLKEYLRSKEERRGIRQAARMNMIIMCLFGYLIIHLVNGFVEQNIWTMLYHHPVGIWILLYLCGLVFVSLVAMLKVDRK